MAHRQPAAPPPAPDRFGNDGGRRSYDPMSETRIDPPAVAEDRRAHWMERVQAGDQEAYRLLLRDVTPELRAYARRHVREGQDAEDLLQDVLLTLHRARHTYDPARRFEPWLYAIARNAAVDAFRRERLRRRVETPADEQAAADTAAGDAGHELSAEAVLAGLPQTQRQALEMVKLAGMSIEEAAARAGVSPGALRVRLHRGYRTLRARLLGGDE